MERLCRAKGRSTSRLAEDALAALQAHDWPGNVRELHNALERGLIMAHGEVITVTDLPDMSPSGPAVETVTTPSATPPAAVDATGTPDDFLPFAEMERRHLESALARAGGNKTAAAKLLGLSLRSLYTKLKRHGLAS